MVVKAQEVLAVEMVRAQKVPAIEVGRAHAESSRGARAPLAEEEEDKSLSDHLVEAAKVTHEWVEVSLLPHSLCSRLVVVDAVL